MNDAITLYECPDCAHYADPEVVQDNGCFLAGHGRPIKVQAFVCGVCGGRDLGTTDGPGGQQLAVVCGSCTETPVLVGHRRGR